MQQPEPPHLVAARDFSSARWNEYLAFLKALERLCPEVLLELKKDVVPFYVALKVPRVVENEPADTWEDVAEEIIASISGTSREAWPSALQALPDGPELVKVPSGDAALIQHVRGDLQLGAARTAFLIIRGVALRLALFRRGPLSRHCSEQLRAWCSKHRLSVWWVEAIVEATMAAHGFDQEPIAWALPPTGRALIPGEEDLNVAVPLEFIPSLPSPPDALFDPQVESRESYLRRMQEYADAVIGRAKAAGLEQPEKRRDTEFDPGKKVEATILRLVKQVNRRQILLRLRLPETDLTVVSHAVKVTAKRLGLQVTEP